MNFGATFALVFTLGLAAPQLAPPGAVRVAFCDLIKDEARFANRIVETRAQLVRLKNGEWAIDSFCIQPALLVFPDDVAPRPELRLESSAGVQMLRAVQRERGVFFEADFVGRFDWTGGITPAGKREVIRTFGKSRMSRRFVLIDVLNPERIVVPKR